MSPQDGSRAAIIGRTTLTGIIPDGNTDSAAPSPLDTVGLSEIGKIFLFVINWVQHVMCVAPHQINVAENELLKHVSFLIKHIFSYLFEHGCYDFGMNPCLFKRCLHIRCVNMTRLLYLSSKVDNLVEVLCADWIASVMLLYC